MISYEPLKQTLKERGMKKTDLLPYMSSRTLAKLSCNEPISLNTINTLCKVLRCRIEDIVVYIVDDDT